jgi:drug/metabolite transporter (DMT)-like permease
MAVIFVHYAYEAGVSPGTAVFLRFAIAAVVLRVFLGLTGQWKKLPNIKILALFLLGLLCYTILGTTWFVALSITPSWLVSLFVALYPLLVCISSWLFLSEKMDQFKITALILVLVGSTALFWHPFEGIVVLGIVLMVFNIAVQTLYVLIGQHWTRDVPPAISTTWMVTGAAIGTLIYAIASNQLSFAFAPSGWIWSTGFAIISTALAIMFLWWGIGLIGPSRAAIIGSLETVFAILLSVIILGETMSLLQISGGILIFSGAVLVRVKT